MDDPFDPPEEFFLPSEQFPPPHADDTSFDYDVLKYFNFSDEEDDEPLVPASPLPLPPSPDQMLCTVQNSTLPSTSASDASALEGQNMTEHARNKALGKRPIEMAVTEAETPAMWSSAANLDCSCCIVLREIFHSNGIVHMKLALHGTLGVFDHAVLDLSYNNEGLHLANEHLYVELSSRTYDWVKNFLIEYSLLRKQENLIVIHDSISAFFDVLCVKMNYEEATTSGAMASGATTSGASHGGATTSGGASHGRATTSGASHGGATTSAGPSTSAAANELPRAGLSQSRAGEVQAGRPPRIPKSKSATQRERTKNLTLDDLVPYFHLPIAEAAKMMDLCATALKKSCRRQGLPRWPHRKIKSIDKMIIALIGELRNTRSSEAAMRIRAEIARLRNQRDRVCAGVA